ncbi:membrane protein [Jeotgalibacillus soli]|uniref:Membrane protein n=1 Tax=Jeotgalibacillus soli TaxID=889306 RepID=A0A0C2VHG0_9BACL|nr:membrane protein [Jeotgalibacillus soli]
MANKTDEAYRNLLKGTADIIFTAGPSERRLEQAIHQGIELELTPIGREDFVFFVNSKNPVKGLTIEQIQGIYSEGKKELE